MLTPVTPESASPNSTKELQLGINCLSQGIVISDPNNSGDGLQIQNAGENATSCPLSEVKSDNSAMSPASRMAMAIRARKERGKSQQLLATSPLVPGAMVPEVMSVPRDRAMHSGQSERAVSLSADEVKGLYARGHRSFTMRDLCFIDLSNQTLSGSNFVQSKLPKATLRNADLSKCIFSRADLAEASLQGANLEGAYFNNADLQGANLQGANLRQASLTNANLRGVNLCGADLRGARVTDQQLAMARTNWLTVFPGGRTQRSRQINPFCARRLP